MNKKHIYETPVSDLLEVRFEENFCGTNVNSTNQTEYMSRDEDDNVDIL